MRPRGEVRLVLEQAFKVAGPCTVREAAYRAQVGISAAQVAIDNMRRAGELEKVGVAKDPHSDAWAGLYELVQTAQEPAREATAADESLDALQSITATWVILR